MASNPVVISSEKARLDMINELRQAGYNTGASWGSGDSMYRDPRSGNLIKGHKNIRRTTQEDLDRVEAQRDNAMRYGTSDNFNNSSNLSFSGVTEAFSTNGNAVLRGGKSNMKIFGTDIEAPNMLGQSLMATERWNQGRFSMGDTVGRIKGLGNISNDVLKQKFMALQQGRPDLYDANKVMSKRDANERLLGLENTRKRQRAKMSNAVQREVVGTSGAAVGDAKTRGLREDLGKTESEIKRVGAAWKGYRRGSGDRAREAERLLSKMIKGYKPAESNLKVREKVVKYKDPNLGFSIG